MQSFGTDNATMKNLISESNKKQMSNPPSGKETPPEKRIDEMTSLAVDQFFYNE